MWRYPYIAIAYLYMDTLPRTRTSHLETQNLEGARHGRWPFKYTFPCNGIPSSSKRGCSTVLKSRLCHTRVFYYIARAAPALSPSLSLTSPFFIRSQGFFGLGKVTSWGWTAVQDGIVCTLTSIPQRDLYIQMVLGAVLTYYYRAPLYGSTFV